VRSGSLSTVRYAPEHVPDDPKDYGRFLRGEFDRISAAIAALAAGHIDRVYALPLKPRDGDIRYLDSTIAPGGVLGMYYYKAGVWTLLG
jgi:hypothetical protein